MKNVVSIQEHLGPHAEAVPAWLRDFAPGAPFPREAFLKSRVVYYPGSGFDGHAVKVFGEAHAAHCYVYADKGVSREQILAELTCTPFRGYQTLHRQELRIEDLRPRGWTPHVALRHAPAPGVLPFGFLEVLERKSDFGEDHGPARLAILFLGADGFAAFDALFCQGDGTPSPYAILIQDHMVGGNYDCFGSGGLLERLAQECQVKPQWLLVAQNNSVWDGFESVVEVEPSIGGQHRMRRYLARVSQGSQGGSFNVSLNEV